MGNWKLYHENLKDPYHATLLHTFLVTFGLLVVGNRSLMLADKSGRHGVMASAKSDAKAISGDAKKEMRAYKEGLTLREARFMNFVEEFDSPWSVTMSTIWPNLIVQREMNTLGVRQIVPDGPHEFIMKWTMFGFEGDDEDMTRHRLRQGNLMGPAGFLGLEDNEAIKFVQDGMRRVPDGSHLVKLDPENAAGTADTLISEVRHSRHVQALARGDGALGFSGFRIRHAVAIRRQRPAPRSAAAASRDRGLQQCLCGGARRRAVERLGRDVHRRRVLRDHFARECRSRHAGRPDLLREQRHDPRPRLRASKRPRCLRRVTCATSSATRRSWARTTNGDIRARANYVVVQVLFDRPEAKLHQVGVYHDKFRRVGDQLKLAERRCVYDNLLVDNALCLPV